MSITQTKCPECGGAVTPGDECPECGARVDQGDLYSLEAGETYEIEVRDEASDETVSVRVEAVDLWLGLPDRRIFWGKAEEIDGNDAPIPGLDGWLLLEENHAEQATGIGADEGHELPGNFRRRQSIGSADVDGRQVCLYRNDGGMSLEEFVELADRRLDLFQVAVIFERILDGIDQLHKSGLLHLAISPRTVRLGGRRDPGGIPDVFAPPDAETVEAYDIGQSVGADEDGIPILDAESVGEPVHPQNSDFDPDPSTEPAVGPIGLEEETEEDFSPPGVEAGSEAREEGEDGVDESADSGDDQDESTDEARPEWSWLVDLGLDVSALEDDEEVNRAESVDAKAVFEGHSGIWPDDSLETTPPRTDGYSPPEFYGHPPQDADVSADVFSLGMLLYYLLAGRMPPASVYTRHTPAIPARNFRPDLPPGLGPVIKRATRPEPDMRYPDIDALRRAFTEAIETITERAYDSDGPAPRVNAAADRHAGIAKRERNPVNQDNVFEAESEDRRFSLMVVADGVSTASYGTGEVASRMTIEVAESVWERILPQYLMDESIEEVDIVEEIIERANQRIVDYVNQRHTPFSGSAHEVMGTTALISLLNDGVVTLGAVGDSRAYLQRASGLEQLTIDHNLWTLGILEGLPADESLSMPRGDALARCLGTFSIEDAELEPAPPGADIFQFRVAAGDTLLLTTDGLIDFAGGNIFAAEENILATLLSEPDPALACLELILLANRGGGGDNIGLGIKRFTS